MDISSLPKEYRRLKKVYEKLPSSFNTIDRDSSPLLKFLADIKQIHVNKIHSEQEYEDAYMDAHLLYVKFVLRIIPCQDGVVPPEHKKYYLDCLHRIYACLTILPLHTEAISIFDDLSTHLAVYNNNNFRESVELLEPLLMYIPTNLRLQYNLGFMYRNLNDTRKSFVHYKTAIDIGDIILSQKNKANVKKDIIQLQVKCWNGIGLIYFDIKDFHTSKLYLEKALYLLPNDPDINNHLGNIHTELKNSEKAIEYYKKALANHSSAHISVNTSEMLSAIHTNIGLAYCNQVEFSQSLKHYDQALALNPKSLIAFQNKILLLGYTSYKLSDPMELPNLHFQMDKFFPQVRADGGSYKSRGNKIHVGFISGDFCNHPVSYFLSPILKNLDRTKFELYCYSTRIVEFPKIDCNWNIIKGKTVNEVCSLIHQHSIDILFDMSGLTCDNRLDVFAEKPAPIQISYCGYPGTSGLTSIDYHITDMFCDNESTQKYYSEKLLFMKHCFLCYSGRDQIGKESPFTDDVIRFGSFNRYDKINPKVLQIWEKILLKCPKARLVIKTKEFVSPKVRSSFLASFTHKELISRVDILQYADTSEQHYNDFSKIDLALDTFPYSGTTTTCECLWFNIPVLTLFDSVRQYHIQNVSTSILRNSDLPEFITTTEDEYIEKAIYWAEHVSDLRKMRASVGAKFRNGHVCNTKEFVSEFENMLSSLGRV
jgi:Predicted O-linked N-acetylglucosamine transferase, SPINDLY family